jgi:hypothetical protein
MTNPSKSGQLEPAPSKKKRPVLAIVGAAVLAVVVVFVAVVATRPSEFHIERSVSIGAPPQAVFPLINDFHAWTAWSPWEHLDPAMKREYSGSSEGPGAGYSWSGNDEVGVGSMLITDARPAQEVTIRLEFKEPWQATNMTTFSMRPAATGTQLTWGMDGENNFMVKAVSLFMDMDAMVGKDFELGLSNLKRLAEAEKGKVAAPTAR